MGICHVPKIIIGSKNTEQGSIQIYGKDAEALILGDPTHEGGDVKIYRDASGNLQFSIDADAASNAIAMSVYGGVVAQNYLTVGNATLDTTFPLKVYGECYITGNLKINNVLATPTNTAALRVNISVSDANDHAVKLQIDANDILTVQATGNSAGDIDLATRAIGVFNVTPQVQQAHIADPTDLATCISALSTLLADLEGYGWLKSS